MKRIKEIAQQKIYVNRWCYYLISLTVFLQFCDRVMGWIGN